MLVEPGTDISSAVCFVNTTLSITFFSEERKWDQSKGIQQKALYPNFLIATKQWRRRTTHNTKTLKPLLSCQSPHERHYPLSEWLTCFVWTKEVFWPFSKNDLYLVLLWGLPHLKKLRYGTLVWITLPLSGCSGESKYRRWEFPSFRAKQGFFL